MVNATVTDRGCQVGSLWQWDRGQVLEIRGLSLPTTPELHFAHGRLEDATVHPATMDAAGVIRSTIPDKLLEEAQPVKAWVCTDTGGSFRSLCCIIIPVLGRVRPGTYEEEESNG